MSSIGRKLLSAVVEKGSTKDFLQMKLSKELFRDSEVELYNFINLHSLTYGKIPKAETITVLPELADALVSAPEPPEYYLDELEKRYLHTSLKTMITASIPMLENKDSESALSMLSDSIEGLFSFRHRQHLFDARDMKALISKEYLKKHTHMEGTGLMFGWPTLDEMTSGLQAGDLASFVGRPASGKTFKLLRLAHKAWEAGEVPLFVSMEMTTTIIAQRLAAMMTHSSLTQLMQGAMTKIPFENLMGGLELIGTKEKPCWVVDANFAMGVSDIVSLCRQLKPTCVMVDGAYLLKHKNTKLNKYERIAENAELLKQLVATDMGVPTIASYQLNRESTKKKKTDKPGLEDIYGSDAIGQLSTIVLGLLQEEGVETLVQRKVHILKGRNGEVGEFNINWDFNKMNFDEVEKVKGPKKELGFIT